MSNSCSIRQLQQRSVLAENMLSMLRSQIAAVREATSAEGRAAALEIEVDKLREEANSLKLKLADLEIRNGKRQVRVGPPSAISNPIPAAEEVKSGQKAEKKPEAAKRNEESSKKSGSSAVSKKKGGGSAAAVASIAAEDVVDVRRLDFRIGRIVECSRHPDADSLYVERVDLNEPDNKPPRTIVSGLVKHVPLNEMQGRLAVFICNLKPAKMRGVLSEGMIMCASSNDSVEILQVPANAVPGDLITVEGYPRTPDAQLNPKKKIFETLKPELRVDTDGFASFKGKKWLLPDDKGAVRAPTMTNAQIS